MRKFISMVLMLAVFVSIVSGVSLKKRKAYVKRVYTMSEADKACILSATVRVGMIQEFVVASLGRPDEINRTVLGSQTNEQWVYVKVKNQFNYKALYVYFENGIVTAWQD